jgi:predicted alpha/beta-fold hydrolase
MSAERVEYHKGATADVKNAVAWYRQRSPEARLVIDTNISLAGKRSPIAHSGVTFLL